MKKDLTGMRIDNFIILEQGPNKIFKNSYLRSWNCLCDCGNKFNVCSGHIRKKRSCGCKSYETHGNRKYPIKEASFRAKITQYKSNAKFRGIDWELSIEDAIELIKKDCYYCGSSPDMKFDYNKKSPRKKKQKKASIKSNGIDRLDSSKGYIKNNVVPCCRICNNAKNDLTVQSFETWIKRLCMFRKTQII